MIPTHFSRVSAATVAAVRLDAPRPVAAPSLAGASPAPPFTSGYFGLLSYDELLPPPLRPLSPAPSYYFRVDAVLAYDHATGQLWQAPPPAVGTSEYAVDVLALLPEYKLKHVEFGAGAAATTAAGKSAGITVEIDAEIDAEIATEMVSEIESQQAAAPGLQLEAAVTTAAYLATAEQVLRDIRAGRFYQLNLLRYFRLPAAPTPSWSSGRLARLGGAFAAWLRLPAAGVEVISFSPERFLRGTRASQESPLVYIEACPIKRHGRSADR